LSLLPFSRLSLVIPSSRRTVAALFAARAVVLAKGARARGARNNRPTARRFMGVLSLG
jgi:hypothetical protein